jgi:prevent-host-death family protein
MREVQASEVKTHLRQPLDDVERRETVVITWHGRHPARILPAANRWQQEIDRAIEGMKALRKRTGKIALNGLPSARH